MQQMWTDEDLIELSERTLEMQDARERWNELRDLILANGGICNVAEDYRELPMCLRRANGFPIDVIGAQFDFDYIEDFYRYVLAVYERYTRTRQYKLPRVPFHHDNPELQDILEQLYDTFRMCLQAKAAYGSRQHPACVDLYETQRTSRRDYFAACKAAGVEHAHV